MGSEVEFRWQCLECGYRERGRVNWPFGLCFPGLILGAASFVLQSEGFEDTAPPEVLQVIEQSLLGVGCFLFALGFLIFIARLIRSNPVRKISCTICDRYFKRSEAWASTDYCSVECAQAETEDEFDDEEEDDEDDEIDDIEEVEEVEEDEAEDVEDVEDVEDDDLEEDAVPDDGVPDKVAFDDIPEEVDANGEIVEDKGPDAAKASADDKEEKAAAQDEEDTPEDAVTEDEDAEGDEDEDDVDIDSIDEDELEKASAAAADANDEVAEMVLFEDKTEYEMWDPNAIVSEASEDLDLDAVADADIEEGASNAEDMNEVEDAISLMDSQRKNVASDRTAMWKVEDILAQTDDLDIMASTRMNKPGPNIESDRFNTKEIPAGITESGEETKEGSGDHTES